VDRKGGQCFAVGRGGSLTGRGADILLLDDLVRDADEARSSTVRRSIETWFSSVAFTRVEPGGSVILVGTRWALSDLTGYGLRNYATEGWTTVNLPAIATEDEPPPLSRRRAIRSRRNDTT
jgi:hypothetical protein